MSVEGFVMVICLLLVVLAASCTSGIHIGAVDATKGEIVCQQDHGGKWRCYSKGVIDNE